MEFKPLYMVSRFRCTLLKREFRPEMRLPLLVFVLYSAAQACSIKIWLWLDMELLQNNSE